MRFPVHIGNSSVASIVSCFLESPTGNQQRVDECERHAPSLQGVARGLLSFRYVFSRLNVTRLKKVNLYGKNQHTVPDAFFIT